VVLTIGDIIDEENNLYLLSIYSKTEKENINDEEIKEALNSLLS